MLRFAHDLQPPLQGQGELVLTGQVREIRWTAAVSVCPTAFGGFLLAWVFMAAAFVPAVSSMIHSIAVEWVFWLTAVVYTLTGLRLPLQQAIAAGACIGGVAWLVEVACATTGLPFASRSLLGGFMEPTLVLASPVELGALWIVLVLNSRGVAKLILRPWRSTSHYGLLVLGSAAVLVAISSIGLELFVILTKQMWILGPVPTLGEFPPLSLSALGARSALTVVLLGLATPWLIDKRPIVTPPNVHPLTLWFMIQALFVFTFATYRLWSAVFLVSLLALAVAGCVVNGKYRGRKGVVKISGQDIRPLANSHPQVS